MPSAPDVAKAYVQAGFSLHAMSLSLDRSRTTIQGFVVRFNLPPSRLIRKASNRAALLEFKDGANLAAACTKTGANIGEVESLLRFDLDLVISLLRGR